LLLSILLTPGAEAKPGEVWLLHRVLYGLKQTSREWYLKLKGQLERLGFKRSETDHSVFTKDIMGRFFVIVIYVDNFLLFSSNIDDIRAVKSDLKEYFNMKDLDEAKWILQMAKPVRPLVGGMVYIHQISSYLDSFLLLASVSQWFIGCCFSCQRWPTLLLCIILCCSVMFAMAELCLLQFGLIPGL